MRRDEALPVRSARYRRDMQPQTSVSVGFHKPPSQPLSERLHKQRLYRVCESRRWITHVLLPLFQRLLFPSCRADNT